MSGSTIVEKILAEKSSHESVSSGDIVTVSPDVVMSNDATTHITIDIFKEQLGRNSVENSDNLVFVIDHNVPSNAVETAEIQKKMRAFANDNGLVIHDSEGVCHQLLVENHVDPGTVVVGADSHTCSVGGLGSLGVGVGSTDMAGIWAQDEIWLKVPETIRVELTGTLPENTSPKDVVLTLLGDIGADGAVYEGVEFVGEGVRDMSIPERITLCNMTVEGGAKTGITPVDEKTREYVREMGRDADVQDLHSDPDATYDRTITYDLGEIGPKIATPHSMDNVTSVGDIDASTIDRAFIGSCANGRMNDLESAGSVLEDRTVHDDVRLIVSPASQDVFRRALQTGLIETFQESGAIVMNPNCSTCWGACQGVLGENERLVSSGTRNFRGRAGSKDSEIFVASPSTVAASAVEGVVTNFNQP